MKGERLSKLVSRLVGVRRIGSQQVRHNLFVVRIFVVDQVDSSSWEFLSAAESSTNTTPTSTHRFENFSQH